MNYEGASEGDSGREDACPNGISLLEDADSIVLVLDKDARVCSLSHKARDLLGYSLEDVKGKNWFETIVPEANRARASSFFKNLISGGTPPRGNYTTPVLCQDRTERMIAWHSVAIKDDNGHVTGTLNIGNDVTDQITTRGITFYELDLMNNVNDAVIARDENLRITAWNRGAERLYGWTAAEALGKGPEEMSTLGYHGIEQEEILSRLKSEGRIRLETLQQRKDGTRIDVDVTATALHRDEDGKIIGFISINRDISERKRVEENLRSIRNYLENLVNYANAPIIVWDPSFRVTRFNHAFERMTGYHTDEVLGRELSMLFPEESREASLTRIKNTLEGEHFESVEIPIKRKDGGIRWALWNSANILAEDGRTLVATIAQGQDITDRVEGEEELRETRNLLENLVNYANAPIIVWDTSFRITRFNRAFERLTGYSSSDVIGQELGVLFPKGSKNESLRKIGKTLTGEYWESVEIPIQRKDGGVRWALWNSANIYGDDGKLMATIAQGQDITDRRHAEQSLRSTRNYLENLLNYANAPVIVWDPSFRITRFNHAFERLTGYWSEEVVGRELSMLFPVKTRDVSIERINETLSGSYWESAEIPILRKDGTVRVALWNSANIYAEDGKTLIATIAQGQDITARKVAEERTLALNESLERQTVELEAVNRELEAFNYSVSHDLRGPLRALDGFSVALVDGYENVLDERGKDYLNHIRQASQRMGQLIDDLLKLSRITRDKMSWEMVNLSSLVEGIIKDLRMTDPKRKVEVAIAEGVYTEGDPRLLKIAMENLVGNAWKFTNKVKDPKIEFGVTNKDGQRVFYIKDNGVGFDMAYAGKLFSPFERLHSSKDFPGTGVGLATAMRIIARHGGRIWAESSVGKGATFYFTDSSKRT